MSNFSGDMVRGHLETVLLSAISRGEAYGYDILQRLNAETRGQFEMKEGTIYPVLHRLVEQGYLAARWEEEEASRKGPRRRLYRLTRKGNAELARRRADWSRFVLVVGRLVEGTT